MKVKKLIPVVLSLLMAGSMFVGCGGGDSNPPVNPDGGNTEEGGSTGGETVTPTPLPQGKKIYLVGDSTVCSFSDNYYLPRYGYGTQLAEYLNVTSDQIVNLAISGRSSKSFLTEENYTTLTNSIGEGDYLIIGFGHNDEKSAEAARFTDPNGTKDEENTSKGTSFKWTLYEKYIKVATDKGATPILCTPIVRYSKDGDYTGAKVHITDDGNYPEAIKSLGEETDTTVIDLTALTKAEYESDNANAIYYHAHSTYAGEIKTPPLDGTETPDGRDDTHINKYGAKMVAYKFATAIAQSDSSLKAHVKENIVAPTKANDYIGAVNTSYVKPDYTPFNPTSYEANKLGSTTTGSTTVDWYKTAMGVLGGDSKVSQYTTTYADGKFSLSTDKGSKFAGSQDGFGAAFVQISVNDNFTASAHVKLTGVGSNAVKQAGFGMMLRDDILIDKNDTTLASNFVAAGLITNSGVENAIFSRTSSSALTKESNTSTYAVNSEYDVSITRVGQTVTVTFADGTNTFTKTYTDFDFVARDNDYMYLCLFANRSFNVEFTNVQFEITGTSQGA